VTAAEQHRELRFPWCAGVVGRPPAELSAALASLASSSVAFGDGMLVGSWWPGELRTVRAGRMEAAFLGTARFTDAQALDALARARDTRDHAALARLSGSYQLLVYTPGGVTLCPDRTGLRRLWYASSPGYALFATHTLVLQRLLNAPLDEKWLAIRLIAPSLRDVLDHRAPFVGVEPVRPGEAVQLRSDRTGWTDTWWAPPPAVLPVQRSAPVLAETLAAAVGHRVASVRRTSCDLSGGLDSTSLAFLARRAARDGATSLVTLTRAPASPANDDPYWVARAVAAMPDIEHVQLADDPEGLPYADLRVPAPLDEPDPGVALTGPLRRQAWTLARLGSDVHLAGNGGDQVLGAPLTYLRRLARQRPLLAARHLRGHRALTGLTGRSLACLAWPGRYAGWLRLVADQLESGGRVPWTWGSPPRPPRSLMTRDGLDTAATAVRAAAAGAQPAGDVESHATVARLRYAAGVHRVHRDSAAALGLRLELPFLDADVVEVCLSTRPYERLDPYRPKPLLVSAMRAIVPDELLARTTMGVYEAELHLGWRQNRHDVASFFEESRLVERGLLSRHGMTAFLAGRLDTHDLFDLNEVLAVELWLRSLEPGRL